MTYNNFVETALFDI